MNAGILEEPCERPFDRCLSCCSYSDHNHNHNKVNALEREVKELKKKLNEIDNRKVKYSLSIDALEKKYSSDANDEWNIYMATWTLLGLMTAVATIGVVFIIKENNSSKKAIELAEMEVNFAKRKLADSVDHTIQEITSKVSTKAELELDIFRKRMELMEIVLTKPNTINNDDIYASVSYLSEYPRTSFVSIYNKLLALEIDEDVRSLIIAALDKIQLDLKNSKKPN